MRVRRWFIGLIIAAWSTGAIAEKPLVTIGFQPVPSLWLAAIADGTVEAETGYKVELRRHKTGLSAIDDMRLGRVDIAYAGSSPIALGMAAGQSIDLFWIAADLHFAEGLVARDGSRIAAPQDLRGKTIAVPFGSTSHYHLLFALEQFAIPVGKVKIRNMRPGIIERSWKAGSIDAAFVWIPTFAKLRKTGRVIASSGWLNYWGRKTFDGLIVNQKWAKRHAGFMKSFTRIIAKSTETYRRDPNAWARNTGLVDKIAKLIGVRHKEVVSGLRYFRFPSAKEQLTSQWLGGGSISGAADSLVRTSEFLRDQNLSKRAISRGNALVDDQWVRAVLAK